jgi:hypothetical protein
MVTLSNRELDVTKNVPIARHDLSIRGYGGKDKSRDKPPWLQASTSAKKHYKKSVVT